MSILNVNKINPVGGGSTITIAGIASVTGSVTATGTITGEHHGDASNLTGLPAANLTGTLPAISGANLTNVSATSLSGNPSINTTGIITATSFVPSSDSVTLGGVRNMVINGDFQVDQRNNGAELSITNNSLFSADRWTHNNDGFTYYKTQRKNDGDVSTIGTDLYMRVTVTTAVTMSGSTSQVLENNLEGNTVKQLNLGNSSAKQCTLSFWVRSSLTGLFGGALQNSGYDRCHPFSYTINSANTWERKTFTFATTGFTSGNFGTGTGVGLRLVFSLGNGPGRQASPDQWHSSVKMGPTGETNLVATNGATLDIAKVQLEVGTQATPFEDIFYGDQLLRCQRYFAKARTRICFNGVSGRYGFRTLGQFTMRAAPTVTGSFASQGLGSIQGYGSDATSTQVRQIYVQTTAGSGLDGTITYEASSEL